MADKRILKGVRRGDSKLRARGEALALVGVSSLALALTGCAASAQGEIATAPAAASSPAEQPVAATSPDAMATPTSSSPSAEQGLDVETNAIEVYEYGEVDPSSPFADELRTRYNPESSLEDFLDSFVIRNKEGLTAGQLGEFITTSLTDLNRAGYRNGLRWVGLNAPEDSIEQLRRSIAPNLYTRNSSDEVEKYLATTDTRGGFILDQYTGLNPESPYDWSMENKTANSLASDIAVVDGTVGTVTIESHVTDNALTVRNSLLATYPSLGAEPFYNKDLRAENVIQYTCTTSGIIELHGLSSVQLD